MRRTFHTHAMHLLRLAMALAALSLLPAACGGEDDSTQQSEKQQATAVKTVTVSQRAFEDTLSAVGELEARVRTPVSPEYSALVEGYHFQEGQEVAVGDLLFTLDDSKIRHAIAEAEAALGAAKDRLRHVSSSHERFRKLYERRTISREEYERRWSEYQSAQGEVRRLEARLRQQRERLEDTRITAPMAGFISQRNADPGDLVARDDVLATIYGLDELEAVFEVPGSAQGRVQQGQQVTATGEALGGEPARGEVSFVAPSLNAATRKLPVKAVLQNPDHRFKPGAFVTITLRLGTGQKRPFAPEQALVATLSGYSVFVVQDGKAVRREVETGRREPGIVEISKGLQAGEELVTAGMQKLRDGAPVSVSGSGDVAPGIENETHDTGGAGS